MKHKTSFALCAVILLAGFFGLQAVSESALPLWEGIGCIAAIIILEIPVIRHLNKKVEGAR